MPTPNEHDRLAAECIRLIRDKIVVERQNGTIRSVADVIKWMNYSVTAITGESTLVGDSEWSMARALGMGNPYATEGENDGGV